MTDWPPDYMQVFSRRMTLLNKVKEDPSLSNSLMVYYKDNPIDWINDWCVTFDPRIEPPAPRLMPFILFDRQVEFVEFLQSCLEDKEGGLVEKARDIGASWLCCAFSVWLWLYYDGTAIGWGSRKEEYVDKRGDPKAIFTKIRQIIQYLPVWMLPEGFNSRLHDSHMKILNPANEASITGEAGDNIGRGGRTTIYFKDESAHYERPDSIEAALGDNTNVQIDISSVHGSANVFYRRRMAGEVWAPGNEMTVGKTRVFIFDWSDHPNKTQEWYDLRRKKAADEGLLHLFKQEVDRDYSGSTDGIIIPQEWVKAAVDAHIKLGINIEGLKAAGQDIADEGGDKNALVGRHGILCNYADHWGGEAGASAQRTIPACKEMGITELYYDCIGVGVAFKTEINHMKKDANFPKRLMIFPWNAGAKVQDPEERVIRGDRESALNKDEYKNLKAQSWFRTRARFYKTYQAVIHGKMYPHDELISIDSQLPKLHELTLELSQAVRKNSGDGKTMVDKKPAGAISPNLADAFIQCYNPVRVLSILDVL